MKYTSKKPFEKGYNEMISEVEHPEMMGLEYGVVAMESGDVMNFDYAQEVVYDLLFGEITFNWDGNMETIIEAIVSMRERSCCMYRKYKSNDHMPFRKSRDCGMPHRK